MHNVRYPLVILGCSALWLLACWPVLLWLIYCSSAVAAVEFTQQVDAIGTSVLLWVFLLLAIGAMVFPPIPAGIRLSFARLRLMLTTDRSTLMRNLFELRHIETPARHLEIGRLALQFGDHAQAAFHLQRANDLEPGNPATLYLIAQVQLSYSLRPAAQQTLAQVVQLAPDHGFGDALLLLGRTTFQLGDKAAGLALLRRHERTHGGNRKSHCWLAEALKANGEHEAARQAWRSAAEPAQQRLTAEENWYRATARVALLFNRGSRVAAQ